MRIYRFEDILAWQEGRELSKCIYLTFRTVKDYGFKGQVERAVISILNNIAEGFERNSDKELKQFLFIAKGSCGEVRSMLYCALDLGYITSEQFEQLHAQSTKVAQLLSGFIKKLAS